MVVPPLRALGSTLRLVVKFPRAKNDLEPRAQEGQNPHLSAPGEKRPNPNPALPKKNLLVHLPMAPRIPTPLPEETPWVHKGLGAPGTPGTRVATGALEVVGIPEVTETKTDEESAPQLRERHCHSCNCIAESHARYCYNCARPLDGGRR